MSNTIKPQACTNYIAITIIYNFGWVQKAPSVLILTSVQRPPPYIMAQRWPPYTGFTVHSNLVVRNPLIDLCSEQQLAMHSGEWLLGWNSYKFQRPYGHYRNSFNSNPLVRDSPGNLMYNVQSNTRPPLLQ